MFGANRHSMSKTIAFSDLNEFVNCHGNALNGSGTRRFQFSVARMKSKKCRIISPWSLSIQHAKLNVNLHHKSDNFVHNFLPIDCTISTCLYIVCQIVFGAIDACAIQFEEYQRRWCQREENCFSVITVCCTVGRSNQTLPNRSHSFLHYSVDGGIFTFMYSGCAQIFNVIEEVEEISYTYLVIVINEYLPTLHLFELGMIDV